MLIDNPFYLLGVTSRDNKETISEAFEDHAADGSIEEGVLLNAQKALLTSKARLEAEVSYLPEASPKKAKEIAALIKNTGSPDELLKIADELGGLSQANISAFLCLHNCNDAALKALIAAQATLDAKAIAASINSNRKIAGFPEISVELVEDALKNLHEVQSKAALKCIVSADHPGQAFSELLGTYSVMELAEKRFVESVAEKYDAWAIPTLRDHEDKIDQLVEAIRALTSGFEPKIDEIIAELKLWDEFAQPSQLIFQAKGLDEPRSAKIHDKVRELCLWLANDMQEHQVSLKLSRASREIFSELPSVANKLDEDIVTLEDLVKQAEAQEEVAPLANIMVEAMGKPDDLIKSINKGEFGAKGKGLAGKIYKQLIESIEKVKGKSYEDEPWQLMRKLAIWLNNDKDDPQAAQKVIQALQQLNPPASAKPQIDADAKTMEGNILGGELRVVLGNRNFSRAYEILDRLIEMADDEEEKQQWRETKATIKAKRKEGWGENITQWIVWAVIVCAIGGLKNCDSNTSSSKYSSKPSSTYSAPASTAPSTTYVSTVITPYKYSKDYIDLNKRIADKKVTNWTAEYNKFKRLADAGNADAQYIVSMMLEAGKGVTKNRDLSIEYMKKAVEQEQPDAMEYVGVILKEKRPEKARNWIVSAAQKNNAAAQADLGRAYMQGEMGFTVDYQKALFWFGKGASQGDPDAQVGMARLYFGGKGVPENDTKGVEWARKAANQNNAAACGIMGNSFYQGNGVQKSIGAAYYWLNLCADESDSAITALKAEVERQMTHKEYELAGFLGYRPVMIKLAKDYYYGTGGVMKDIVEADTWIRMHGFTEDPEWSKLKGMIESEMTQAQLDVADAKFTQWFKMMLKAQGLDVSDDSTPATPAPAAAPDVPAAPLGSAGEIMPALGQTENMTMPQLRWCTYEQARIAFMNRQFPANDADQNYYARSNADLLNEDMMRKVNGVIANYRGRCLTAKYWENQKTIIDAELLTPAGKAKIASDMQETMRGWNPNFLFRD